MFLDRSVQRILVGASNSVSSKRRFVFMPASLTVLSNTVPTPIGPSVALRIFWTRGLHFGSLVPSARNANTSAIGRSITVEPLNSLAMRQHSLLDYGIGPYSSRSGRQGLPTPRCPGGSVRVTTLPAPTTESSPTVTPGHTITPAASHAPAPIVTGAAVSVPRRRSTG